LAEFRNHIYHFAAEERRITYLSRRLRVGYSDARLKTYLNESDLGKRVLDFLNLTHVCRQIRAEYSPIYAAETKIHVCHPDVAEFIASDCPHMARDGESTAVGNLVIDCRSKSVYVLEEDRSEQPEINMSLFLEYGKSRSDLRVICGSYNYCCPHCDMSWATMSKHMSRLFALSRNQRLQDRLSETVDSVSLCCSPCLELWEKKGKDVEWMSKWNNETLLPEDSVFRK
jgi:hypothetical protein